MRLYRIHKQQYLPINLDTAWKFISTPRNLQKITPKWMDFTITSEPTDEIYEGMIITYCVKIIPPISTVWVSEITHVQAPHFFVDEQRHGPYRFWHHQHILEEKGNGVLMQDIVHYSLPIPIVGRIMNFFYIRHKLEEIFTYRRNTLKTIFGKSAEEKD